MVNGGDGNDIFVNGPAIQPSPDAIEEFRVITNTFDAEYGRNSGSVVNVVTKSGTNAVHGDFYEFLRNQALNTEGYFDPFKLDYQQNQFGATLGGPIKKDRTFIFGSYEGNRLIQGISSGKYFFLPQAKPLAKTFSGPFLRIVNRPEHSLKRLKTVLGAPPHLRPEGRQRCHPQRRETRRRRSLPFLRIITSPPMFRSDGIGRLQPVSWRRFGSGPNFARARNRHERGDQFTIRLDHKITSSQQFSAYYYFNDDDRTDPFSTFHGAAWRYSSRISRCFRDARSASELEPYLDDRQSLK